MYEHLAEAFEGQVYLFFYNAINEGLNKLGISSQVILTSIQNLNFKCQVGLNEEQLRNFYEKKANMLMEISKRISSFKSITHKKYKALSKLYKIIHSFEDVEFDSILFAFDKNYFRRKHTISIFTDKTICLTTPFVIIGEVTIRGSRLVLEYKLLQSHRLLSFFKNCFEFIKHNFLHPDAIEALIKNDEINIYPFIIIDGLNINQHDNFNRYKEYQYQKLYKNFNYYKMIKGVATTAMRPIFDQSNMERVKDNFLIDLIYLENAFAPKKLLDRIDKVENSLTNKMYFIEERVKNLEERMENLEGRMEDLEGRMEYLERRMEDLEGRMEDLEGRMEDLEGKVDRFMKNTNVWFIVVLVIIICFGIYIIILLQKLQQSLPK